MATFTFTKKLLKGELEASDPNVPSYTIRTKLQWIDNERKTTDLIPHASRMLDGTINWKKDEFRIGEERRKCADIKSVPGKLMSNVRDWQWLGPERTYRFAYDKHIWTATRNGLQHPSVKLHVGKSHTFKDDEISHIEFTSDVSPQEYVFLTLVMIYSETRRKAKIEGAVAGGFGILSCLGSCAL